MKFTNNFQEDSTRRDFTINAMSYDFLTHTIYDYNNGYEDLANSRKPRIRKRGIN